MTPKRTIRDIRIPKKKKTERSTVRKTEPVTQPVETMERPQKKRTTHQSSTVKKGASPFMWLLVVVIFAAAAVALFNAFHRAAIEITPYQEHVRGVDIVLDVSTAPARNRVRIDSVTMQYTQTETLDEAVPELVSEKATGTIMIFNEESSSQRFVEETRFETPEGLIFMLEEAVTVPARSGDEPGSIEVRVHAQETGEVYNIELTDFVIPGWRETNNPRFETQYARSTSPMTGGFEGMRYRTAENGSSDAYRGVSESLEQEIRERLSREIPMTHILLQDSYQYRDISAVIEEQEEGAPSVIMTGEGGYYMFDRALLSEYLAQALDISLNPENVRIIQSDRMAIQWDDLNELPPLFNGRDHAFQVRITGDIVFEYDIDAHELSRVLRGLPRKEAHDYLRAHEGIESYNFSMRPFWKLRIPHTDVRIDVTLPESET